MALAYAAIVHVRNQRRQIDRESYLRIFEVAEHLGSRGGSIASKMIAAYELRKFPEYGDVVSRVCDLPVEGDGGAADLLKAEMSKTKAVLRK